MPGVPACWAQCAALPGGGPFPLEFPEVPQLGQAAPTQCPAVQWAYGPSALPENWDSH